MSSNMHTNTTTFSTSSGSKPTVFTSDQIRNIELVATIDNTYSNGIRCNNHPWETMSTTKLVKPTEEEQKKIDKKLLRDQAAMGLQINPYNAIENIIFNNNTTVVLFRNGHKELVRINEDDEFDPEVALAMAISNMICGTRSNFKRILHDKATYQKNK